MTSFAADSEIEALQKKAKHRFIIMIAVIVISFILFLILGIYLLMSQGEGFFYSLFSVVIADFMVHSVFGALLYFIIAKKAYDNFNYTFKNKYVMQTIIEAGHFKNVGYSFKQGFSYEDIRCSGVINSGQKAYFESEDMLKGTYNGVEFCFSDVITKKLVSAGKNRRVEVIFSGQVIRFAAFNEAKASDEYLQVFQKEFLSDIRGWTADHKIETENVLFNDRFQIYADNEHNAFYILTPELMEKIIEFSESVKEQISVAFYDKVMYVAINRFGSIFDGKIDVPIANQKELILSDLHLLQKAGDILLQRRFA